MELGDSEAWRAAEVAVPPEGLWKSPPHEACGLASASGHLDVGPCHDRSTLGVHLDDPGLAAVDDPPDVEVANWRLAVGAASSAFVVLPLMTSRASCRSRTGRSRP